MSKTFIEMFCGIGGFRLGLEKTNQISINSISRERTPHRNEEGQTKSLLEGKGWMGRKFRCVWANDHDKYACQVYRKNFGDKELVEADIKTVDADTIPNHTLLTAGFPCQAFSIAGKRKGFKDTRGTLFYDIVRVAKAKRPSLLLLENVKGLLSHDEGLTFQIIIESLEELGYLVEWQVLNSKHFGVPQNRERVFIVGHLGGTSSRQIFPIGESGTICIKSKQIKETNNENSLSLTARGQSNLTGSMVANALTKTYWKGPETYGGRTMIRVGTYGEKEHEARRVYSTNGLSKTLKGRCGALGAKTGLYVIPFPLRFKNRNQKNFDENLAMSVDTTNTTGLKIQNRVRRLTPTECERLQGFPDGWTKGLSDTQRYKVLGNAVTVNVIEYLGKLIE